MGTQVPDSRVRRLNALAENSDGRYVLYWMTSQRRTSHNFALQRAVDWGVRLGRGLLVLEALRCDYEWASDRFHRFVIDGMEDNLVALRERAGVTYYPFVEREAGAGRGLLEALAEHAAVVVADDYPTFFLPRMLDAGARRLNTRVEAVDSFGLLPMREADRAYPTAYAFRRYLQKCLPAHLRRVPEADPVARLASFAAPAVPGSVVRRWAPADLELAHGDFDISGLPVDHTVDATTTRGGSREAVSRLDRFLAHDVDRYAEQRNHPDSDASSRLSPYLHFGHISTHSVFERLAEREAWDARIEDRPANGKRAGWWGMSEPAEAFLDQLVTWRELGFNMAANNADHGEYESLPDWARRTLEEHAGDPRPYVYRPEQFESGSTHDPIWNAAQRQLRHEGRIHNYLRMLWGKKILEWTQTPRDAARIMIELNNRYALDGRDPNSYSGIYWCLGRYDRPWGPERAVFGKIRYMTSASTARKLRLKEYLERHSG